MSNLKSEERVDMEMVADEVKISLQVGGNVRLINKKYNMVRKEESAIGIEWMIKGEEALRDFLVRIGLKYNGLGKILRDRLKDDLKNIEVDAERITMSGKECLVPIKNKPLKDKQIEITIKWVKGKWRKAFPAINIVIPLSEYTKRGQKYEWRLTVEEAIEIGYTTLYWISASEISEGKGLKTAEGILGKIE
ncbi:hypothetical protein CEE36_01420 [candidate division TA06 bacterium B3_TA06]|uniref:Uncharacterized protein n=1 Tax=candidate division TA06 bacterium B3_TA06 TaxID=2012487 RepID=A0A532VB63_UNCT6|nr:MAG: hypothetical protein CEE36_01420 [candidate division TA06 bacterium B3_TA06]